MLTKNKELYRFIEVALKVWNTGTDEIFKCVLSNALIFHHNFTLKCREVKKVVLKRTKI